MLTTTRLSAADLADKARDSRALAERQAELEELRHRFARVYGALVSHVGKEKALAIARGQMPGGSP